MRALIVVVRLGMALATVVAVTVSAFAATSSGRLTAGDFAGYITTDTSLFAAVVLTASAVRTVRDSRPSPRFDRLRLAAVTYSAVALLGRGALGAPWEPTRGYPIPAVNVFLDLILFAYLAVDWIVVRDHSPSAWSDLWWLPTYPVAWIAITVIRGMDTGWSPYPLLDPTASPGKLAIFIVVLCVGTVLAGGLAIRISRRRDDQDRAAAQLEVQ